MDDSGNIRSLSPEKGKINQQSRIHTSLACGFGRRRPSEDEELFAIVRGEVTVDCSSFYSLQRLDSLFLMKTNSLCLQLRLFPSVHLISAFVRPALLPSLPCHSLHMLV